MGENNGPKLLKITKIGQIWQTGKREGGREVEREGGREGGMYPLSPKIYVHD